MRDGIFMHGASGWRRLTLGGAPFPSELARAKFDFGIRIGRRRTRRRVILAMLGGPGANFRRTRPLIGRFRPTSAKRRKWPTRCVLRTRPVSATLGDVRPLCGEHRQFRRLLADLGLCQPLSGEVADVGASANFRRPSPTRGLKKSRLGSPKHRVGPADRSRGLRWVAIQTCASETGLIRGGQLWWGQPGGVNSCCNTGVAGPAPREGACMTDSGSSQCTMPVAPTFVGNGALSQNGFQAPIPTSFGATVSLLRGVRICPPWHAAIGGSGLEWGGPSELSPPSATVFYRCLIDRSRAGSGGGRRV